MDDLVKEALAKWPDVPDCYGWLALDARGRWRIGTGRELIRHAPTTAFIGRNYLSDAHGRWLFQNGPQRVYVALEYTPFVWHLERDAAGVRLVDHCGATGTPLEEVLIDDSGRFLFRAAGRIGVLHDHDSQFVLSDLVDDAGRKPTEAALDAAIARALAGAESGLRLAWPGHGEPVRVTAVARDAVARRYGFEVLPVAGGG